MTKQEVLEELKSTGNINSHRRTPTWEKAFDLYNAAHPNNKRKIGCGTCFNDVKKWLQS